MTSRATDALLKVLSDPTAGSAEKSPRDQAVVQTRVTGAALALGAAFLATLGMTFTAGHCRDTTSGLPFSLIDHEQSSTYNGLMVLSCFTYVVAGIYLKAVLVKPRPQFLHVAGAYLLVNSASLFCLVVTIWGGCKSAEILRVPTAVFSLVGLAATSFLLQYCILAKVEALSSASGDAHRNARWWFHLMLNPWTVAFGVGSSIMPLGVAGWLHEPMMKLQMCFILFFLVALGAFTASAVTSMLRCAQRLADERLELSTDMRMTMRRLIVFNAVATASANAGTFLWFVSILGVYMRWWVLWYFFAAYALDNALHTLCAFFLSGLLEAVGSEANDEPEASVEIESLNEQTTPSNVDVIQQLKEAGKMVGNCSAEDGLRSRRQLPMMAC